MLDLVLLMPQPSPQGGLGQGYGCSRSAAVPHKLLVFGTALSQLTALSSRGVLNRHSCCNSLSGGS